MATRGGRRGGPRRKGGGGGAGRGGRRLNSGARTRWAPCSAHEAESAHRVRPARWHGRSSRPCVPEGTAPAPSPSAEPSTRSNVTVAKSTLGLRSICCSTAVATRSAKASSAGAGHPLAHHGEEGGGADIAVGIELVAEAGDVDPLAHAARQFGVDVGHFLEVERTGARRAGSGRRGADR